MTQSALLFAASFAVVFALGLQQQNITHGHRAAAFGTSLLIGLGTLVQLKVVPGPTTPTDIAAYLVGSACGVVVSMWMHPHLVAMFAAGPADKPAGGVPPELTGGRHGKLVPVPMALWPEKFRKGASEDRAASPGTAWGSLLMPMPDGPPPSRLQARVDDLGERLRLATELADEVARSDIESYCPFEAIGNHTWYDTRPPNEHGTEVEAGIVKALRYLDLRGGHGMHRHPQQPHLVRFDA